jgi:glycine/D-amino acid oxidase-like deaminating enzyme/nitrite reductase/ring-hydroxylating ferredoxin subunit
MEPYGPSRSLWVDTAELPGRPPLEHDLTTDVCVIGAGIAGLTTAYLLAREGREVTVIDDGPVAGGETSHTTAHLTNVFDDRYVEMERLHGPEGARILAESHSRAIDTIMSIAKREAIECDFERLDAYLFVPPGDPNDILALERDAAHRAGLTQVSMVERAPIAPFHTGVALRFPRQGMFHPLRYVNGLVRAFERMSGRIHGDTHALEVHDSGRVAIQTRRGPVIHAHSVVVATNSPFHVTTRIHTRQAPYRTYAIAALVPHGAVTRALYYDTPWPYHYVRLQTLEGRGRDVMDALIVGGEDHKTGQEDDGIDRFARLEHWARERFPEMERVAWRWSGQVMEPVDGVAFIGRDAESKNVYLVTGDSGMGMTHGTIAGLLITDLIQGRENHWSRLYDPSRRTLGAMGEYLRENLNVAKEYAERLGGSEVHSTDEIARGGGAVVRHGIHQVATYRDAEGRIHEHSAVCPHLGCVVHWNSVEASWDCPCHGSRFDPYGRVLNGPASGNLEPYKHHKDERAA